MHKNLYCIILLCHREHYQCFLLDSPLVSGGSSEQSPLTLVNIRACITHWNASPELETCLILPLI